MTTLHEIALLRLAAQHIAVPLDTPIQAVHWLGAVQAQDYPGVLTSVALRTTAGTRQAVETALDAGEIVKSWPMRGTLHFVAAEDLPWMLELTAARVVAGAATRRAQLGLNTPQLEQARTLAATALAGGRQLRREELLALWDGAGLSTAGQRGYHMLWHVAQTGTLCFGPVQGGEQLVVLVEEWIPRPRRLERAEALGELALRYFRSHGPATVKDFIRWTGLRAGDARTGLGRARPQLRGVDVEGIEYLMDAQTPELLDACRTRAQGVFLLPGFDEFILGYQDRQATLRAEFADRIVPGGNGMFQPTIISDGQVIGTWKRTGRVPSRTLAAAPFTSIPDEIAEVIPQVYAALP